MNRVGVGGRVRQKIKDRSAVRRLGMKRRNVWTMEFGRVDVQRGVFVEAAPFGLGGGGVVFVQSGCGEGGSVVAGTRIGGLEFTGAVKGLLTGWEGARGRGLALGIEE